MTMTKSESGIYQRALFSPQSKWAKPAVILAGPIAIYNRKRRGVTLASTSTCNRQEQLGGEAMWEITRTLRLGACIGLLTAALPAAAQTLVVLEKSGFKADLVDVATGKILAKLPTGQGPHEVAISPDGRTAYIPNYGPFAVYPPGDQTHTRLGNTITVIDLAKRAVKTTFDVGTHAGPHDVLVSRDGKYLWVTTETPMALMELDAATGKLLHLWPTKQNRVHMVVPTPDEKKFYLTNTVSGSVSVLNRSSGAVKVIPTGPGTEGIAISPDGREVWVASRQDSKVEVISAASDKMVATFPSGGEGPVRVAFTPDGKQVWVTNSVSNTAGVFDARGRMLLGTVPLGKNPSGIIFSRDGSRVYITSQDANTVNVIDVAARKVLSTVDTGEGSQPDGIGLAVTR
jgi:YVTN family beta-propeller protein